ncbi:MAG: peroxiredoxin [Spirochaetes bacterium GWF1_31_7]|nr:MAG: peroxiredoxin [Spirochaetes bacterium GWE1_32_154]OHD48652.1 MAG: peroxiredoxin [Spirochaetes bacterium GWF1_31_7]OHD50218.1 MAG: peroxiredoxin [Spirochaetes bacterium GWE2_31_10]OHD82423.1 MAG: peroxiredoxin [Spirochaetes bacterium RIFOXYB1_FULL_32_8]HBD94000.1 thioredoxin-dependent thiol peroxidase [Spirochaetia bacterium]
MLKENDMALDFQATLDNGNTLKLSDFQGKKIVLYFYPKDDTPGCTTEACGFRDSYDDFMAKNAIIIGVSPDGEKTHAQFRAKYNLQFFLLTDTEHTICELYDVWKEKNMYGRKYMGVMRTTFIIDESGRVSKVFEKVKPANHAKEILDML